MINQAEMKELVVMLEYIAVDNGFMPLSTVATIVELNIASESNELEVAKFSEQTQEFIKEVRANEESN
jgi:hypothetical protein